MVALHLRGPGELVEAAGEVEVEPAQPVAGVGGEGHVDDVVDIRPFRMVVELLRRQRSAGHEAPGLGEAPELPDLADAVALRHAAPAGFAEGGELALALGLGQALDHASSFPAGSFAG